jgi:hypothetical protein
VACRLVAIHPAVTGIEPAVALVPVQASPVAGDRGPTGTVDPVMMEFTAICPDLPTVATDFSAVVPGLGAPGWGRASHDRGGRRSGRRGLSGKPGAEAERQCDQEGIASGAHCVLR